MAGHSKWANIKHRKAGQDAKRGKIFTKLIRELTVSAKEGGGDPASNARLRSAIDKALANNMKRDTIDRAVARGAGQLDSVTYESLCYEGYAPGGGALMIECLTDRRTGTVAELRHQLSKGGGNLATAGAVAYLFERKGIIEVGSQYTEEEILEIGLANGAQEIEVLDNKNIELLCDSNDYETLKSALQEHNIELLYSEIRYLAQTNIQLDLEGTRKILTLVAALEDLDDVQQVHTNLKIDDEMMRQLSDEI